MFCKAHYAHLYLTRETYCYVKTEVALFYNCTERTVLQKYLKI